MRRTPHIYHEEFGLTAERYPVKPNVYTVEAIEKSERDAGVTAAEPAGTSREHALEQDISDVPDSGNEDSGGNSPESDDYNGSGSRDEGGSGGSGENKNGSGGSGNDRNGGSDRSRDHNGGSNSNDNCGNSGNDGSDPGDGKGNDNKGNIQDNGVDEVMEEDEEEEAPEPDNAGADVDAGEQPLVEPEGMKWQDSTGASSDDQLVRKPLPSIDLDRELAIIISISQILRYKRLKLSDVQAFFESITKKQQLAKPIPRQKISKPDDTSGPELKPADVQMYNPEPDSTSGPELDSPKLNPTEVGINESDLIFSLNLKRVTLPKPPVAPPNDGMPWRCSKSTETDELHWWKVVERAPTPELTARLQKFEPNTQKMKRKRSPAPRPYPDVCVLRETKAERLNRICNRDRVNDFELYDCEQGPSGLCFGSQDSIERCIDLGPALDQPGPSGVNVPGPSGAYIPGPSSASIRGPSSAYIPGSSGADVPPPRSTHAPLNVSQPDPALVGIDLTIKTDSRPSTSPKFETEE